MSDDADWRHDGSLCERTGNLCGTDTWRAGSSCPCAACQRWLASRAAIDAHTAALAEAGRGKYTPDQIDAAIGYLNRFDEGMYGNINVVEMLRDYKSMLAAAPDQR